MLSNTIISAFAVNQFTDDKNESPVNPLSLVKTHFEKFQGFNCEKQFPRMKKPLNESSDIKILSLIGQPQNLPNKNIGRFSPFNHKTCDVFRKNQTFTMSKSKSKTSLDGREMGIGKNERKTTTFIGINGILLSSKGITSSFESRTE